MKLLAILAVLLFLAGIAFAVLIFPVWALVHVAISTRSNKAKTLWIILMILSWPITGLVYGLFASKQKALRWLAGLQVIGIAVIIFGFVYSLNLLSSMTRMDIVKAISKTHSLSAEGLTKGDLQNLRNSLAALKAETQPKVFQSDKLRRSADLMELFSIIARDNKLTAEEYKAWMDSFNTRQEMDPRAFERYIRELKAKQL